MHQALDEGREAYLAYLVENEVELQTVEPVVAQLDRDRAPIEALARLAAEAGDHAFANLLEQALGASTNDLLALMNTDLRKRMANCGSPLPENVFAGVFPTNTLNAHAISRSGWNLILLNTGTFEFLEAALAVFLSVAPGEAGNRAQDLARLVEAYCSSGGFVGRGDLVAPRPGGDRAKGVQALVTACEQFVLAHEYGHIAKRHLGQGTVRMAVPGRKAIDVLQKSKDQEFEADLWAANALLRIYRAQGEDPGAITVACAGPLMFLLLTNLVEEQNKHKASFTDTHPPTWERYTSLRYAYAKAGVGWATQMAGEFAKFCHLAGSRLGLEIQYEDPTLLVADHVAGLVEDGLQAPTPLDEQINVFSHQEEADSKSSKGSFWGRVFGSGSRK